MKSTNYAIIGVPKYKHRSAALTASGTTPERLLLMCSQSNPNSTSESIPYGYCHCGCGEIAPINLANDPRRGYVKGEPRPFITGHRNLLSPRRIEIHRDGYAIVPMPCGDRVLIDEDDIDKVVWRKWSVVRPGGKAYAHSSLGPNRPKQYMHRLIMGNPDGLVVDHINGNGLDNRKENLRICTRGDNQRNRLGKQRNNTSGYIGVHWHKGRWVATVSIRGKNAHIGRFKSKVEAAKARDAAALRAYGEFATLNFPLEQGMRDAS